MRRGRAQIQSYRAARHAEARQRRRGQTRGHREERQIRQAAGFEGLLLQAALEHRFQAHRRAAHHLDFDIWLGPAPKQPFHRNLVHYNWHWFWDFGCGDIGNQGVHEMDVARWAMGGTLPRSVVSLGGRYVDTPDFKDQGQTPNQLVSVFDFGGTLLLFETRGLVANKKIPAIDKNYPSKVANELYFEEGVIKGGKFLSRRAKPKAKHWSGCRCDAAPPAAFSETSSIACAAANAKNCGGHIGRPSLQRRVPPGQHLLSPGQGASLRKAQRISATTLSSVTAS